MCSRFTSWPLFSRLHPIGQCRMVFTSNLPACFPPVLECYYEKQDVLFCCLVIVFPHISGVVCVPVLKRDIIASF